MSLRDEFLPASWSELGHALASMLVFALLMAGAAVAPAFAPELADVRDAFLDFLEISHEISANSRGDL